MSASEADPSELKARRILDIVVHKKRESAHHVAAGYECLRHSVNAGTWFGKSEYIWVRRNKEVPNDSNAILDVAVVQDAAGPPHGYVSLHRNTSVCRSLCRFDVCFGVLSTVATAVCLAT